MKLGKRAAAFLAVFQPVFEEYQKQLGGRIDFDDMILRAAHYAETGRYMSPFRHILVDEFQDISQSRAQLVKALKGQHLRFASSGWAMTGNQSSALPARTSI